MSYGRYEQQKSSKPFKKSARSGAIGTPAGRADGDHDPERHLPGATEPLHRVLRRHEPEHPGVQPRDAQLRERGRLSVQAEHRVGRDHRSPDHRPGDGAHLPKSRSSRRSLSQGFFPLDGLAENVPFQEGTPTTPADAITSFTSSSYYQYDTPPVSGGQEEGYCNVVTTDGNTGHQ